VLERGIGINPSWFGCDGTMERQRWNFESFEVWELRARIVCELLKIVAVLDTKPTLLS
jgi:hypothetical protein